MESPSKVELIKQAIQQMMEEVVGSTKSSSSSDDDGDGYDNRHRLLSKLMSQLEKLEDEQEGSTCPTVPKSESTTEGELTKLKNISRSEEEDKEERIVKELNKVRRQNLVTHCLLSVMIVLTVAWQISEVSIILKLKDGVSHPFRSFASVLKSMIKPRKSNGNDEDTESSITSNLIESTPVHDLKISGLPHVEMPKIDFGFNGED